MKISDVMSRALSTVPSRATLRQAAELMREKDLGMLPVQEAERLVGVLTDRDIVVRAVAEGSGPDEIRVEEIMTNDIVYCFEDQDLVDALQIMEEQHLRRLLVYNRDGDPVGVVSVSDIPPATAEASPRTTTLRPGQPH